MTLRSLKRTAAALCLCLFLVASLLAPFAVSAETGRVFDNAALFSGEQAATLEKTIQEQQIDYALDIVIYTTDDAGGKTARAYADDAYDDGGFGVGPGRDGLLFLIDMDNREIYLSTSGRAIDLFTDSRIDAILDDAYAPLAEGDYFGAANRFLQGVRRYASLPPDSQNQAGAADSDPAPAEETRGLTAGKVVAAVFGGAAAGLIFFGVVAARYRYKDPKYTYPLREKGRLQLTETNDVFLGQHVTHRRIQTPPKGGNGGSSGGAASHRSSSTHTSKSGATHGGGGRKF